MKKKATSLFLALVLCLGLSTFAVHADGNVPKALYDGEKFDFGSSGFENISYTFWIPESGLYSFTPYPASQNLHVLSPYGAYDLNSLLGTWYEDSFYLEFEADDSTYYELITDSQEIQYVIAEYHGKDASVPDEILSYEILDYEELSLDDNTLIWMKNGVLLTYETSNTHVTIPDIITELGKFSMAGDITYYTTKEVIIPNSVTKIDDYAFFTCEALESVTIPSSVVEIGEHVFESFDSDKGENFLLPNLTVYGEAGSYAQTYCQKNNIPFQVIGLSTQPTTPTVTVENIPASGTAVASTQTVTVDGKPVEFQMYALLDENGNGTNYIKLRDMAHVLNGTKAQFSVGYSNEAGISATSGQPYQDTGSEMSTPFSGDRAYTGGGQSIQINGAPVEMTAISLLDDNGGGYTYFKLRDLGTALGFNVGWSAEQGIFVETE